MPIPSYVARVLTELEARGFQAFCVGGCVRDCLLGRVPEDWDVTTSALPEQTMALFGQQAVPTGLRHGTVTVVSGGKGVEVTTFRVDGAYGDNRHPDSVTFTRSLPEDLARRDFTVNAMAMDLRGRIQDPWGGQADLERRCLRCVGEPERRFREDALRMLRAVRFAAQLGFSIEKGTLDAIRRSARRAEKLSGERIKAELEKILLSPRPELAGELLRLGLGQGGLCPEDPGGLAPGPLLNGEGLVGQLKVQAPAELVGPSGEEGVQIVPVVFVGVDLLGVFPGPALHFLLKGEGPQGQAKAGDG